MGRTENNRIVNFAAPARLIGQMVDVIITDAHTNSLRAGSPTWTATPKDRMTQARSRARRSMPTVVNLDGDNTHLANLCGPWTKTCGSWPTA